MPTQEPLWQVDVGVQIVPSSHVPPSLVGRFRHAPEALHCGATHVVAVPVHDVPGSAYVHSSVQQSPPSQFSRPDRTYPSPQVAVWQLPTHASVLTVLPSSHCSPARRLSVPSWQVGSVQSASHVGVLTPPSSQLSPFALSMTPSPQNGSVQSSRHAFGVVSLFASPLSHSSAPVRTKPSPQVASTQLPTHRSLLLALPSSHCSPESTTPFGHCGQVPSMLPSSNRSQLRERSCAAFTVRQIRQRMRLLRQVVSVEALSGSARP